VVAAVALLVAALLIGRWVGSAGGSPKAPPEIAPVRPSLQRSDRLQADSVPRVPGIAPALSSSTPPRR
jgi:hypothetical protein